MANRVSQRVAREMGGGAVKTWSEVIALGKLPGVTDLGQGNVYIIAYTLRPFQIITKDVKF